MILINMDFIYIYILFNSFFQKDHYVSFLLSITLNITFSLCKAHQVLLQLQSLLQKLNKTKEHKTKLITINKTV